MKDQELNEWRALAPAAVQERLQIPSSEMPRWRRAPGRADSVDPDPMVLPSDDEAAQLLIRLGVDAADVSSVLRTRPDERRHPEIWWLLDRSCRILVARMGRPSPVHRAWPAIVAAAPVGAFLFVWAFLAVLPTVRVYHASVGLSDEESWATLGALGHELQTGRTDDRSGLGPTWILPLVFSGTSFRLGRLAFDQRHPHEGEASPVLMPGEGSWNIHVPSGAGPITPAVVTDSMDRAVALSRQLRHPAAAFCCHSWLMDSQLMDLLPWTSNIVQFQGRFDHFSDCWVADSDPIYYIFRRHIEGQHVSTTFLDQLPQHTSLQRAIVSVLRSGRHWRVRTGWTRVADPKASHQRQTGCVDRAHEEGAL